MMRSLTSFTSLQDKTVLSLEEGKLKRAAAKVQRFENFEEDLQAISNKNKKWEMISNVWVEMLAYATFHCRGNYHAQQLKQSGERLTHVWLLMAHFGIN